MKRLLIVVAGLVVLGVLGFGALAWRPAIAPIAPPAPASFRAGPGCEGRGARRRRLLRGVPHRQGRARIRRRLCHGDSLRRDLLDQHHTRSRDRHRHLVGGRFCPRHARRCRARRLAALPGVSLQSFHKLSDDDVQALYAYFMTRAPVHAPAPREHDSRFHSTSVTCKPDGECCSSGPAASNPMPAKAPNGTAALTLRRG